MDVDLFLLGLSCGVLLCVVYSWMCDGFNAALDAQLRIARARLAAKRAHRDRLWPSTFELTHERPRLRAVEVVR